MKRLNTRNKITVWLILLTYPFSFIFTQQVWQPTNSEVDYPIYKKASIAWSSVEPLTKKSAETPNCAASLVKISALGCALFPSCAFQFGYNVRLLVCPILIEANFYLI